MLAMNGSKSVVQAVLQRKDEDGDLRTSSTELGVREEESKGMEPALARRCTREKTGHNTCGQILLMTDMMTQLAFVRTRDAWARTAGRETNAMSNACLGGPSSGGVVASVFIDKAIGCRSTGHEMAAGLADEPTVMPNLVQGDGAGEPVGCPVSRWPDAREKPASATSIGWKIQFMQVVWSAWAMISRQKPERQFHRISD
jgi:hypothetical protein